MNKKVIRGFFALFIMQLLVACGGGGDVCKFNGTCDATDGTTTPTDSALLSMKLISKTTGLEVSTVGADEPVKLEATIIGTTESKKVTFTTDKGTLSDSGSALSSGGQASVDLIVGSASGAGTATATITIDGKSYTSSLDFQISSVASSLTLKLISSLTGNETKFISIADPGRLEAKVSGTAGPVIVLFKTTKGTISNSGAVLTDESGVATVDLLPGEVLGAGTVIASIELTATEKIDSNDVLFEVKASDQATASGASLQFVSASPETIAIKGTGGGETSVLEFKVLDNNGTPVKNQVVNFALDTTTGGITLSPASATSDSSGIVRTIVQSGTVKTPVRVTASIVSGGKVIAIPSSRLIISTGIPVQNSFSLSADTLNSESLGTDGVIVNIIARLADGFKNPVPDGTVVSFTAEGGVIEPSCQTEGGACSVKWTSQEPRPLGASFLSDNVTGVQHQPKSLGQPYAGRVTITASAIGEESFADSNGNGRLDAGKETTTFVNGANGQLFDIGEAFTDYNEDGVYNPTETGGEAGGALEVLLDFNSNGQWDKKDGKYNGSLCAIPAHAGCSNRKSINIYSQLVLVMSGSTPVVSLTDLGAEAQLCVSDINNQRLPAGSSVTIIWDGSLGDASSDGLTISPVTQTFKIANSSFNGPFCVSKNKSSLLPGTADVTTESFPGKIISYANRSI